MSLAVIRAQVERAVSGTLTNIRQSRPGTDSDWDAAMRELHSQ